MEDTFGWNSSVEEVDVKKYEDKTGETNGVNGGVDVLP